MSKKTEATRNYGQRGYRPATVGAATPAVKAKPKAATKKTKKA